MIRQDFKGDRAIAKGRAWTIMFRVLSEQKVELATNAATGATTLNVKPLDDTFAGGDMLLFGENTVLELTAAASPGETALTVVAIPGPLYAAQIGYKVQDLTGFDEAFEVSSDEGDATPVIASDDLTIAVQTQTGADRGKVRVTGLAATTTGLAAKTYAYSLWRRNSGSERPQAYGDFQVVERGFLS